MMLGASALLLSGRQHRQGCCTGAGLIPRRGLIPSAMRLTYVFFKCDGGGVRHVVWANQLSLQRGFPWRGFARSLSVRRFDGNGLLMHSRQDLRAHNGTNTTV